MDIRDLDYFLACCKSWQLHRRRPRCHIVQSAMSSAIARLERDLGVRLFDRGVMPVALTEHGATLQAGAQRILDAVPPARDDVAAVSGQIRGTVTLGTTLHTGPLDLARVLANVRDRHPDVVIKLHQPKDGSVGSCNRSAAGQWISPYALAPPNMSPIRCRVEPLSTICLR